MARILIAVSSVACGGGHDSTDTDAPDASTHDAASPDAPPVTCPATLAAGSLFDNYPIDGTTIYGGPVTTWAWTVTSDHPCDQLLLSQGQPASFTVTDPAMPAMTLHPVLTGDYTVHVDITPTAGAPIACSSVVHVGGPGLRIEQCSDLPTTTDLDLHLHKSGTTTAWFGVDDCDFQSCLPDSAQPVNFGDASSPLSACVGDAYGSKWQTVGACRNPRIDIDSANDPRPESFGIDDPNDQDTFRVAVDLFAKNADVGAVHPGVVINCGGQRKVAFGFSPQVSGFTTPGGTSGSLWRVADVTTTVVNGNTTDCSIAPIHPPGMADGFFVTVNSLTF